MMLKLAPDGSVIVFASLFGGTGDDVASGVAVGTDGSVCVSGASEITTGFPKGFVARLAPGGDAFLFSTLLSVTNGAPCPSITEAGVDVLANFVLRNTRRTLPGRRLCESARTGRPWLTLRLRQRVTLMAAARAGGILWLSEAR
jgi:hypothetical protein